MDRFTFSGSSLPPHLLQQGLDPYDQDTLAYLSAIPGVGEALLDRVRRGFRGRVFVRSSQPAQSVPSLPVELSMTDPEPPHGSVLMLESLTGTAVQRFFSDGRYHASTGMTYESFRALFVNAAGRPRKVFLIYRAEED